MTGEAPVHDAALQLLRMTEGLIIHHALHAAARLGVADALRDGPRSTSDLAVALDVNEHALYRTLRFLSSHGVFVERAGRLFSNTSLSNAMRTDVAGSIRAAVVFRGTDYYVSPFTALVHIIQTGVPAHGRQGDPFEGLRQSPDDAGIFDEAMTAISELWASRIAEAYDFGQWQTVMDVGGGNGCFLAELLKAYRTMRGVLADQPAVLERAVRCGFLAGALAPRVRLQSANFLEAVPGGCRAYLMKNVIHDWDDSRARCILLNCRRVVPNDGAVLLVEYRLGDENEPSVGKAVDLAMLAITGGRERTVDEHRQLLASAGFRLTRTVHVGNDVTIYEARPEISAPAEGRRA